MQIYPKVFWREETPLGEFAIKYTHDKIGLYLVTGGTDRALTPESIRTGQFDSGNYVNVISVAGDLSKYLAEHLAHAQN